MHVRLNIVVALLTTSFGCERPSATPVSAKDTNPVAPQSDPVSEESKSDGAQKELKTVDEVDLDRYLGKWYEYARYPNAFQKNIVGVIAEYRLRKDGRLDVINSGKVGTLNGKNDRSKSLGWVVEDTKNTRWRVQFIWPFSVPYWIIDLDDDYQWAVVGQPSRKYLWVLSRTAHLDEEVYRGICKRLQEQGYDSARLKKTPQPNEHDGESNQN